jgi:hypothetical protein
MSAVAPPRPILRLIKPSSRNFSSTGRGHENVTLNIKKSSSPCPVAIGFCPSGERRRPHMARRISLHKEECKMDKSLNTQRAQTGVLATLNRRFSWTRLFLPALFLTLIPTSLQATASAQSCAQQCHQQYIECLRSGPPTICDSSYDACLESCMVTARPAPFGITLAGIDRPRQLTPLLGCRPAGSNQQRRTWDSFGARRPVTAFNSVDLSLPAIRLFE